MKKIIYTLLLLVLGVLIIGAVYVFTYTPPLSKQYGVIESKLYLGNSENQPLLVAFGGGGGGNDWARDYLKEKRDSLVDKGFAILAVGYFNSGNAPEDLDRISLDAISDSILSVANHPKIDEQKIILLGGSKGGELALNLASRFDHFKGVIALSTSHVSFPALTWSANTASWMYNDEEVPYVPASLEIIGPALKGDLYTAHNLMLEDTVAVARAEIRVENINGPVLVISGKNDDQWPATRMSNRIMQRLIELDFKHYKQHIILDGGHIAPLENFDGVYRFLEEQISSHKIDSVPKSN